MSKQATKTPPSFHEDMTMNEAIDSLKFLEDVGQTDLQFLEHVLAHCTVDQLMRIENGSKGRDLTPVTDKLWKNFYEKKFGKDACSCVIKRMKHKKVVFKWKRLYEAKMEALEKKAAEIEDRVIQNYEKEKARKQTRQTKLYEVSSSSCKKRSFGGTTKIGCNTTPSNYKKRSFESTTKLGRNPNKSMILKKPKRETYFKL